MLYISLLRGLNVGGHGKLAMADLKKMYEALGFQQVTTIGNTGVVLFFGEKVDDQKIGEALRQDVDFPVYLVSFSWEIWQEMMLARPNWFNAQKTWRHNALFMLENGRVEDFLELIEQAQIPLEQIMVQAPVIFWSTDFSDLKKYRQSAYQKLLKHSGYKKITIRNGNTLAKISDVGAKMMADHQNLS
ncbi:DUF1697 domain-containing protein [Enterococcus timonensis]|uniref:DUF1697 domain-containing protein n=1 Tax=Enterococcus timonensis TaxID=1852364 RepID=UPI0008DAEEC9|nr:DUF1697 domain-containing protein [Enterococcus timonensis]